MVARFIARMGITAATLALFLGTAFSVSAVLTANYWYTFGLWPKSWWSFFGYGFASLVLMVLGIMVSMEEKK